jgi:hypothetical protein
MSNVINIVLFIIIEFLPEVREFVGVGSTRPRFRKRDKVLFYGRKMLRKVCVQAFKNIKKFLTPKPVLFVFLFFLSGQQN